MKLTRISLQKEVFPFHQQLRRSCLQSLDGQAAVPVSSTLLGRAETPYRILREWAKTRAYVYFKLLGHLPTRDLWNECFQNHTRALVEFKDAIVGPNASWTAVNENNSSQDPGVSEAELLTDEE